MLQELSREAKCTATNGKKMGIITVFSHLMRYFKNAAIKQINSVSTDDVDCDDIKWVITVPAIWNDGAKQVMREAAYEVSSCYSILFCLPLEDKL